MMILREPARGRMTDKRENNPFATDGWRNIEFRMFQFFQANVERFAAIVSRLATWWIVILSLWNLWMGCRCSFLTWIHLPQNLQVVFHLLGPYNCFLRWVLILSRNCIGESNWSFDLLPGWQADNILRSILTTPLLLNEIRDLHANVPHCSDPHSSWCLTRFWHSTNIDESVWCFRQITMHLPVSCFQTKLHENVFQFRADFLKQFSVQEEFTCALAQLDGSWSCPE